MASRTSSSPAPRQPQDGGVTPAPQAPVDGSPNGRTPTEPHQPTRRPRRILAGLAAEAAVAQAERARRAAGAGEHGVAGRVGGTTDKAAASSLPVPRAAGSELAQVATCRCGSPATSTCADGCGNTTCGGHLLNRASRLAWRGPYRSEREHTAYLGAFWADTATLCAWCREEAGARALASLPPVPPLPAGAAERLAVLLRHPHDYPSQTWAETVRQHGGAPGVVRLIAPRLFQRKPAQDFEGRRKSNVLTGVSVGRPGTQATYELVDAAGTVWRVRPLGNGMVRRRRAWAWERASHDHVAWLLPRIVELAAP